MGASPIAAHDFYSQAQARSNLNDIVKELRAIFRCLSYRMHRAADLTCTRCFWAYSNFTLQLCPEHRLA